MLVAWICIFLVLLPAIVWLIGVARWAAVRTPTSAATPRVSVIVAARDEAESISACLAALAACHYPVSQSEIIVVDDHSQDNTSSIVRAAASVDARIQLIPAPDEPQAIGPKKRALAAGIQASSAELILLTDADCIVPPRWIERMAAPFSDPLTGAVYGASIPSQVPGILAAINRCERNMVNVTMASAAGWGSPASACGHSIAYRRTALAQINGFARPTLPSGDDDLTIQAIAKAGWNVKFIADSDAVVTDVRIPDLKAKLNATARHQSTTKYYPLTWRVLYLASVISALLVIALPLLSIFWPRLAQVAFVAAVAKVSTDATTALTVSRRLKLGLTLPGAIISAATLPLIALMRAIIFFAPKFQWKSTQYPNTAATPRQPAEST